MSEMSSVCVRAHTHLGVKKREAERTHYAEFPNKSILNFPKRMRSWEHDPYIEASIPFVSVMVFPVMFRFVNYTSCPLTHMEHHVER